MQRENKNKFLLGKYIIFFIVAFSACIDEPFISNSRGVFILVKVVPDNKPTIRELNDPRERPGEHPDNVVQKLRILVFDGNGNILNGSAGNSLYNVINSSMDVIQHPVIINTGNPYTMVFVANEPSDDYFQGLTSFNDLKNITFPADAFDNYKLIPMIQVIKSVKVLDGIKVELGSGTLTDINGYTRCPNAAEGLYNVGEQTQTLILRLDRLAVRLNVVLESEFNLDDEFESIVLSNIPEKVPLFQDNYPPGSVDILDDNIIETRYTYAAEKFTDTIPSGGMVWAKKLSRIILPAHYVKTNDKATILTVKNKNKYSPSCKLMIENGNFNLPYNTWLDLTGKVKRPLEVNITAQEWTPDGGNWEINKKILDVSLTNASITDFNGVRVAFWSNMPRVRILPTVEKEGGGTYPTNKIFNDIAVADNQVSTTRFFFNPEKGTGYIDIIADGGFGPNGNEKVWKDPGGTYVLTLSGEDEKGDNVLQKQIRITITQNGYRFQIDPWSRSYRGVFFRHDEKGERIITAQHYLDKEWTAIVPEEQADEYNNFRDWIILSSTPSFDPNAGTDNPGNPEKYEVIPNQYIVEEKSQGAVVKGKGRIYFRLGLKKNIVPDKSAQPKYGYIYLTYWRDANNQETIKIYVREGEAPDYLYRPEDRVERNYNVGIDFQPFAETNQKRVAAKFSPFNLTAPAYLSTNSIPPTGDFIQLSRKGGVFVEYPTQGGAYFHWAVDTENPKYESLKRAAYNPLNRADTVNWIKEEPLTSKLWKSPGVEVENTFSYIFETCPDGYRRPTDGYVDQISYNGYYTSLPRSGETVANHATDIFYSEMRSSLFLSPFAGNANAVSDIFSLNTITGYGPGTFPTGPDNNSQIRNSLPGTAYSFYADGFFDRRPIRRVNEFPIYGDESVVDDHYCTAGGTTYIAYPGTLFFNSETNASLFFPASGRFDRDSGRQYRGETGYYWSSSTGPPYSELDKYGKYAISSGAWNYEIAYYWMMPKINYINFGNAIRCVVDDPEPTP